MELAEPRGRSAALLEQVRGAAADLARSEELAREDIRLAAQARAQITEAGQAISQARGYSSMGMGIDTSASESQVMQAEQLLQAQNYEQSIQLAGAGMQSARRDLLRRHAASTDAADGDRGRATAPERADGRSRVERRQLRSRRRHGRGRRDPRPAPRPRPPRPRPRPIRASARGRATQGRGAGNLSLPVEMGVTRRLR